MVNLRGNTTVATCLALFSFISGCRWIRKPESFIPTVENLHIVTLKPTNSQVTGNNTPICISDFIANINNSRHDAEKTTIAIRDEHDKEKIIKTVDAYRGIDLNDENIVFVMSCGFKLKNILPDGVGTLTAYRYIRDNIINGPCIVFDYPDKLKTSDWGQAADTKCLEVVCSAILEKNPQAKLILIGECRGAKTILKYAAHHPENIHGIILETPLISVKKTVTHFCSKHLNWLPGSKKLGYLLFRFFCPKYKENGDQQVDLNTIPSDLPIFIGHLKQDTFNPTEPVENIIKELKTTGHKNVYYLLNDTKISHARFTTDKQFQQAVNAFLHKYDLPCNENLAQQGAELLKHCQQAASNIT